MDQEPNSAQICMYTSQLADWAATWRGAYQLHRKTEAYEAVQQYHTIMTFLWALPWDADLDPYQELPDYLMPAYYIDYWKTYRQLQHQLSLLADQWRDATLEGKTHDAQQVLQEYDLLLKKFFNHAREDKRLIAPDNALLPVFILPEWYLVYLRQRHQP